LLHVWSASGSLLQTLRGHSQKVTCVTFQAIPSPTAGFDDESDPGGNTVKDGVLLSGSKDGSLRMWRLFSIDNGAECLREFRYTANVFSSGSEICAVAILRRQPTGGDDVTRQSVCGANRRRIRLHSLSVRAIRSMEGEEIYVQVFMMR
jgi:WD40 repeat protein